MEQLFTLTELQTLYKLVERQLLMRQLNSKNTSDWKALLNKLDDMLKQQL